MMHIEEARVVAIFIAVCAFAAALCPGANCRANPWIARITRAEARNSLSLVTTEILLGSN